MIYKVSMEGRPMGEAAEVKSKVEAWRGRIAEQIRSGQSICAFCEDRQLRKHTFYYWKKKFRDMPDKGLVMASGRFIPISKIHAPSGFPRIHLPNGVRIELGAGLECAAVDQFLRGLCGVGYPPQEGKRARS